MNEIDKYWYDKLLDLRNFVGNQDLTRDPYMLMVEIQDEIDNMMMKGKK